MTSKSRKHKQNASKRLLGCSMTIALLTAAGLVLMFLLLHYGVIQRLAYYAGSCSLPTDEIVGIDISHYQGPIDWDKVCFNYDSRRILQSNYDSTLLHRRVDFAYAKATEGADFHDWRYHRNQEGIRHSGIRFGAYHFFSYSSDPAEQARNFIDYAGLQSGDLPPVLDIEGKPKKTGPEIRAAVLVWLRTVEKHYGCKPLVYTYHRFYQTYFEGHPEFDVYDFWIARYPQKPSVDYRFWQCSDRGRIVGCPWRPVDINVYKGDRKAFNALQIP